MAFRSWARGVALVALVAVFATAVPIIAPAEGQSGGQRSPTPEGFEHYLVFVSDGAHPGPVPHLFGEAALDYQHEVMGRSDEEIAANRVEAAEFMAERYGLDFSDSDTDGSATMRLYVFDPRARYTAHTVSGEFVPPEGWEVRDGGWVVNITESMVLHGSWGGEAGTAVPAGSILFFGDYNIARRKPNGRLDPIIISYQSASPVVPTATDSLPFRCEITHDEWGEGIAQGIFTPESLGDGLSRPNVRNVLTFPGAADY